ncbi:MAG: YHS domain-containing protein [Fimbriimonadaceae bacterium]|nr:YHS domain-containing protein [Fimbriimonadaceae bacterium]
MKRHLWILFVAAAMTLVGCSGSEKTEPKTDAPATGTEAGKESAAAESTVASTYQVIDGVCCNAEGKPVCPVMGSVVESKDKAFEVIEHEGVQYYICCGMCPDKFRANPEKYAVKPADKG